MIDDCSRENLGLIADTSISGARVARELDALVRIYGKPACIVSDNPCPTGDSRSKTAERGTEFTSRAILKWPDQNDVPWHYIDPGRPQQNAFILRRGNAPLGPFLIPPHVQRQPAPLSADCSAIACRAVDELLNEEIFDTLDDARQKLALWRYDYNTVRPHLSIGNQTPKQARQALAQFEDSAPTTLVQPGTPNYQNQNCKLSL